MRPEDVIDAANRVLRSSSGPGKPGTEAERPRPRVRPLAAGVKGAISELDRFSQGDFSARVATGIGALDRKMRGGMRPGGMVLIGAPSGAGKTALAQQIAAFASKNGSVLFVSPEMDIEDLAEREIIRRSGRKVWDRNPWLGPGPLKESCIGDHARVAGELLREQPPIYILDQTDATMLDVWEAATEITNLRLVVIDYAQQVAGIDQRVPRYLQVGEVGAQSVEFAQRLKVPFLVCSQVNVMREKGKRTYTFRETAVLEQKAAVVLILDVAYRDAADGRRVVDEARLICTKHRGGPLFRVDVNYEPELYRISDEEEDAQQDLGLGASRPA